MRIEFWGVRGAFPTPDADKIRYGGNTNCVVMTSDDAPGHLFILDAGTGLARFGSTLNYMHEHTATVLLSHLHLQHIIGFQFTPFAFGRAYKTLILGPSPRDMLIESVFDIIMEPNYSPVFGIANLMAQVRFVEVDSQLRQVDGVIMIAMPFEHSPDTYSWGYRLGDSQGSMVYLTDTNLRESDGSLSQTCIRLSYNIDVLIIGANDPQHQRSTDTSYADAVELARTSHVKQLVLYHHHPDATDDDLDAAQEQISRDNPDLKIMLAAEQMVIEL